MQNIVSSNWSGYLLKWIGWQELIWLHETGWASCTFIYFIFPSLVNHLIFHSLLLLVFWPSSDKWKRLHHKNPNYITIHLPSLKHLYTHKLTQYWCGFHQKLDTLTIYWSIFLWKPNKLVDNWSGLQPNQLSLVNWSEPNRFSPKPPFWPNPIIFFPLVI